MGVRDAMLLLNFFQGRPMQVKWHDILYKVSRSMYLVQSNDTTDGLTAEGNQKFIDDLSI